jgi:queuine/archaeosine tRNA-ribosyltransferase
MTNSNPKKQAEDWLENLECECGDRYVRVVVKHLMRALKSEENEVVTIPSNPKWLRDNVRHIRESISQSPNNKILSEEASLILTDLFDKALMHRRTF